MNIKFANIFYQYESTFILLIIMFFFKNPTYYFFSSDVWHPVRMFSQTVLAADPGLDTLTSSFFDDHPLDQLIVKVAELIGPLDQLIQRVSSQKDDVTVSRPGSAASTVWENILTGCETSLLKNSKLDFSKEHYYHFYAENPDESLQW